MKTTLPLLFAMLISFTANSQIISQFTWEATPVSKAAAGPDALSYTAAATSSAYGTTGRGLNAGNTREDINLILPGSYFDVTGIDIAIDFRREESEAYFFARGSFLFGMNNGSLTATYLVKNGASTTTVTTGNVYNIPTDHIFHTYRFRYNDNTGRASLSVDGTNVYTTPAASATLGQALSWSTGNVTIGYRMDGASTNVAILDNLLIQAIPPQATLPLKLLSFSAAPKGAYAAIN